MNEETKEDIYLAIRSKLPKKVEIGLWTEKKVIAFLLFFERFIEEGRIRATVERRIQMEKDCVNHDFWAEFVARIDTPVTDKFTSTPTFTLRLTSFARNVLSHLKTNPHLITPELEVIMERNPRCHWALNLFRIKKGTIGVETVMASDIEATSQYQPTKAVESTTKRPEVMFNDALVQATSLLRSLTKGIKQEDLKKLTTKEKLSIITPLIKTVGSLVGKYKPNKAVFQQININSGKRAELEGAFLKYAEQSMKDNEE